jgi:hypothetical protein
MISTSANDESGVMAMPACCKWPTITSESMRFLAQPREMSPTLITGREYTDSLAEHVKNMKISLSAAGAFVSVKHFMDLRESLRTAGRAARANLRPAAALWILLSVFLTAYLLSGEFRRVLQMIADFKTRAGYPFSFGVYVLSAALLPELLQVVFFQGWRPAPKNARDFLFGALVWGCHGVFSDWWYRCQALWFGAGNDWQTLITKVAMDQFVYSPLANGWILAVFFWRERNFSAAAWRVICSRDFIYERYFPLIVAVFCVWIPGTGLIYFMPSALQLPVASIIMCFWVLLFTFLNKKEK